jgi:predicted phage terminase large subunit-like protein
LPPQQLHRLWMKGKIEAEIRKRREKERELYREYRESFNAYRLFLDPKSVNGWWQNEVAQVLQEFYNDLRIGKRPILIIEAPPQHGKSRMVIDFVTWVSGLNSDLRVIYTSFSDRLGVRANLRAQRVYTSDAFKKVFPDLKINSVNSLGSKKGIFHENAIKTKNLVEYIGAEGYFRNTTVLGSITGESLDLGIIDDPIKGNEKAQSSLNRDKVWEWFANDFFTRFSEKAGMIAICTRWHLDDPIGRLQEKFKKEKETRVISYPAIATKDEKNRKEGEPLFPELKSLEFLLERKRTMDNDSFQALYQQCPQIEGGNIVKREWLQQRCTLEDLPRLQYIVVSFDTAWRTKEGNDYTVGVAIGVRDKMAYVLEVWRKKIESTMLESSILSLATKWSPYAPIQAIVIEETPNSEPIIRSLEKVSPYPIKGVLPKGEKSVRLKAVCGIISNNRVTLIADSAWELDFIDELCIFPKGKHDDQVDGLSLGLGYIQQNDISELMYAAYVDN